MLVTPHVAAAEKSPEWLQLQQTDQQATLERSLHTRSRRGVLVCWWLQCHHLSRRGFQSLYGDARRQPEGGAGNTSRPSLKAMETSAAEREPPLHGRPATSLQSVAGRLLSKPPMARPSCANPNLALGLRGQQPSAFRRIHVLKVTVCS